MKNEMYHHLNNKFINFGNIVLIKILSLLDFGSFYFTLSQMNIKHFALVHILNNVYYNKEDDEYTNDFLQTVYEREWNWWIVELINHIEKSVWSVRIDGEQEIYEKCLDAIEKHLLLFVKQHND